MSSRYLSAWIWTVVLLSLGACAATAPPADQAAQIPVEELLVSMDRCIAGQEQAAAQLQAQGQQLEWQLRQLEAMGQKLESSTISPKIKTRSASACPKVEKATGKQLVGYLEKVWLPGLGMALTARLDTGAETASIDVRNVEQFERDGKPWVRFAIINPQTEEAVQVERRLRRTVGIVQAGAAETERRPVVKLEITIGRINQAAEFTLSERSHDDYQVNLGRTVLQDVMVVDVSEKNITPYVLPQKGDDKGGKTP